MQKIELQILILKHYSKKSAKTLAMQVVSKTTDNCFHFINEKWNHPTDVLTLIIKSYSCKTVKSDALQII